MWTLPPVTPARSSSFTEKSAQHQHKDYVPSDNVFAALVLRQVHMRKKAASSQQSRRKPTASSSSTEESQKFLSNEWSSFIHQSAASAAPAVDRAAERSVALDLRTGRGVRRKSQQLAQGDLDLLQYGPWDRFIHERRRRIEEEKAAQRSTERETVFETEDSSESDSAEAPWAPPDKEQPPPPAMPPHWHAFREREKQKKSLEKERESQRKQRQRDQEWEAFRREHHQEERACEERQKRHCSQPERPHSSRTEPSPEPQEASNTASDDTPLPSGVWRPWHFPFFARRAGRGKAKVSGGRRSWVRGWRWGNARVSPEPGSGPGEEEGAALNEDPVVELAAEDLIADIDDELDRSRGHPLQERRRIFRELQRRLHPDKNPTNQESSKFAFQYLMDSRQSYLR